MCCYLSKEGKNDMIDTIKDFFFDGNDGCDQDCINCLDIEYCHTIALQKLNHGYAEALGYGGYNTEDEFWEQL